MPSQPAPADIHEWFSRRGLPSLLAGTPWRHPTRGMVLPLLLAYVLSLLAFIVEGEWLLDALVVSATIVLVWVVPNLLRRRRPFARVEDVGPVEMVLFVVVPAALRGLGDLVGFDPEATTWESRVTGFVAYALVQLLVLGLVWLVFSFGIASLTRFLLQEFRRRVGDFGVTVARTVPLLIGVVTFFQFTAEIWQSIGRIHTAAYTGVILLFVGVSGLFTASKWQLDLPALAHFSSPEALDGALAAGGLRRADSTAVWPLGPLECPLGRAQRANLRLVVVMSRMTLATMVALAVFVFFLLLSVLSVDATAVKAWSGADPRLIGELTMGAQTFCLAWEHLKVAAFLAVFTGFYFSVVSATDPQLRAGLADTAEDAVREACAARVAALSGVPLAVSTTVPLPEPGPASA